MTGMTVGLLKWVCDTRRGIEQRCRCRANYLAHRDVRLANQKAYAIEHHDEVVAYFKEYNQKRSNYRKAWEMAHPGRFVDYYARNTGKMRQRAKTWHETHKEADREYAIRYATTPAAKLCRKRCNARTKAIRRALGPIDMKGFAAKCADLQWVCQLCGKILTPETVTVDHIVPVAKGGTNALENLQPLCQHCNSVKRDKPMSVVVGSQYLFD